MLPGMNDVNVNPSISKTNSIILLCFIESALSFYNACVGNFLNISDASVIKDGFTRSKDAISKVRMKF